MAFSVVATSVSRPVPDQIRIAYELRNGAVVVDTGSVTMTLPNDPADTTPALRRQRIRATFKQAVRERVQAMRVADADYAAIAAVVAAGQLTVGEGD